MKFDHIFHSRSSTYIPFHYWEAKYCGAEQPSKSAVRSVSDGGGQEREDGILDRVLRNSKVVKVPQNQKRKHSFSVEEKEKTQVGEAQVSSTERAREKYCENVGKWLVELALTRLLISPTNEQTRKGFRRSLVRGSIWSDRFQGIRVGFAGSQTTGERFAPRHDLLHKGWDALELFSKPCFTSVVSNPPSDSARCALYAPQRPAGCSLCSK